MYIIFVIYIYNLYIYIYIYIRHKTDIYQRDQSYLKKLSILWLTFKCKCNMNLCVEFEQVQIESMKPTESNVRQYVY